MTTLTSSTSSIISKGYARPIPANNLKRDDAKVWYIPHHGVYHPNKPEKSRVVYDCSLQFNGVSFTANCTKDLILQTILLGY